MSAAQVAVFSSVRGQVPGSTMSAEQTLQDSASTKSSKYKGVHWDKTKSKWVGYIHMKGKKHHLGYFATEAEAARSYDRESLRCRGFTKNFPKTDYPAEDMHQVPEARKALEKSSRYTGVSWNKLRRKWAARIIVDGRSQHLGHFTNEADAARAYDRVCFQSRGSTKNFPAEEYEEIPAMHMLAPGSSLLDDMSPAQHQQLQHVTVQIITPGQLHHQGIGGEVGEGASRCIAMEENSQDSSTCAEPLKSGLDCQPRLFFQNPSIPTGALQGIMTEGMVMSSPGNPAASTAPTFNMYTASPNMQGGSTALQPVTSYQQGIGGYHQMINPAWTSQPATSAPQLLGYSASLQGLASLLPIGTVKSSHMPTMTYQGGAGNNGQLLVSHPAQSMQLPSQGSKTSYALMTSQPLQGAIPASFTAASSLHLQNMLHASNMGLAPVTPQASNMAQLQALLLQNSAMLGTAPQSNLLPNMVYKIDRADADGSAQKRQRLDSSLVS